MHFSTIVATALVAVSSTMASPAVRRNPVAPPLCQGLANTPSCCAVNVLGVADLNCGPPPSVPTSDEEFVKICAAEGQQAQCCLLDLLGQALVCQAPPG